MHCAVFLITDTCGVHRLNSCDSEMRSFHLTGYVPVTAITFLDKLTLKEKDAAYKMAQRTTGSSWQTTFFITNYTSPEHDKTSCEIDRAALDILDSTLLSAERFIQSRKQREKNRLEKEIKVEGKVIYFSVINPNIHLMVTRMIDTLFDNLYMFFSLLHRALIHLGSLENTNEAQELLSRGASVSNVPYSFLSTLQTSQVRL